MTNPKNSEPAILEKYRVALENVSLQPEIAANMNEFGYTPEKIGEGKELWRTARSCYNLNKREDNETLAARKKFDDTKNQLDQVYRLHRKKAKVAFKNDPVKMALLGLAGSIPDAYLSWLETIRKFYANALVDEQIGQALQRMKLITEELTAAQSLILKIEQERTTWLREVGESQEATQTKDKAMAAISIWIRDFYDVARIALGDTPQLLEALGLTVRN